MLEALEPLAGDHARRGRRTGAAPAAGFPHSFDLFGGAEALDDLCALSNECSRVLNRTRAALGPDKTAGMDAALAALAPLFDVPDGRGGAAGQQAAAPGGQGGGEGEDAYGPVRALVAKARTRAEALAAGLPPLVAAAAAPAPAPVDQGARDAGGGEGSGAGGGGGGGGEPEALGTWRAAAERSLGEVASGQVMLLLQHARSLSAPARFGRPLDDGVEWPDEAEAAAALLRADAVRMVADLRAVEAAFAAPLAALAASAAARGAAEAGAAAGAGAASEIEPAESSGGGAGAAAASAVARLQGLAAAAESLCVRLAGDADQAVARVCDALREQLFVLVLAAQHREGRLPPRGAGSGGGGGDPTKAGGAAAGQQETRSGEAGGAPAPPVGGEVAAASDPPRKQKKAE